MVTKTITLDSCVSFPITEATAPHQIWRLFYSIVSSRVTDPKSRGTKWVHANYPDQLIENLSEEEEIKSMFPIVVIEDPNATSGEPIVMDEKSEVDINEINIEIHSDRSDTMTEVWQSIDNQIRKITGKDLFQDCGLFNIKLTDTDTDSEQQSGVKIHVKTLTYEYSFPRES